MPVAPSNRCKVCGGSRLRKDGKVAVHYRSMGATSPAYRRSTGTKFIFEQCPGSNQYPNPEVGQ
jgi:hypothetical protein